MSCDSSTSLTTRVKMMTSKLAIPYGVDEVQGLEPQSPKLFEMCSTPSRPFWPNFRHPQEGCCSNTISSIEQA